MVLRGALIFALAVGAFAGPAGRSGGRSCATTCPDTSKFNLETGSTYEYDYSADIKTSMVGASEEHSSLHLTATAKVEVLSKCELALRLEDVVLQDSQPSDFNARQNVPRMRAFSNALQSNPLRFAWLDGEVEHVCPDEEPTWVLNVKRGVISHFQNTMDSFDTAKNTMEVDISGRCPVAYRRSSNGFTTDTITKVKDVLACRDGHHHLTIFHGIPYEADSRVQSNPVINSNQECEQDVTSEGYITRVVCSEVHQFRPFSVGSSGASTEVMTSLTFRGVSRGVQTSQGPVSMHEYLIYDRTPTQAEMTENYQNAEGTLDRICSTMTDDVRPEVPSLFVKLVDDMRKLDIANLMQLHRSAGGKCEMALKFFGDAVGKLGTSASVTLIRNLIQDNSATEWEAEIWLTTLSFISRPDTNILAEAAALLPMTGHIGRKAHLAVSSLVHNYCHVNSDCADDRNVQSIVRVFEDNLNYNCKADHEQVMLALKSLANTGVAHGSAAILNRCFMADDVETDIRVEAMKAFRRLSCDVDRTELMRMYIDSGKDSELRINAFLQVIKCANSDVITQVRSQLESEQVNQVGSFVWTYLTNLIESSDPLKQEIAEILMDERLAQEFDLDMRKFSSNIEKSMFSHMLNMGGTMERNLIWSENSFMPRSASVNLTVHMFGHSMNLLELGGRAEGLDQLLYRMFGPEVESNQVRNRRSVIDDNDINVLDASYARAPETPKGGYYVKVFGNEIRFENFQDFDMENLQNKFNYLEWLIKLSEDHNIELTDNSIFLSASYELPTAAGMPFKMSAEGASTVNLKVNGRMDLRSLISNPSRIDILGSIQPSAAIEITSEMSVDAWVARTGMKMVSTLHSSTVVSGKLEMESGRILTADFNMPRDRLEVFDAQSKFYITHRGQDREQRMNTDTVITRNECLDLVKSMGIELCAEASVPISTSKSVPLTPFTGPASVSVYGIKRDTFEKFHFQLSFEQERNRRQLSSSTIQLVMDTPGSRVDREISIYAMVNHLEWSTEMRFKSPWKQATFNGNLDNEDTNKALTLAAVVDETDTYSLSVNMPIRKKKNSYEATPEIRLVWPGLNDPRIVGTVTFTPGRKMDFTVRMRNVFEAPAKASGSATLISNNNRWKNEIALSVQASDFTGNVGGFVDIQDGTTSSRVSVEYTNGEQPEQSLTMNHKFRDQSTNTLAQYLIQSQWTSTLMPSVDGDLELQMGYGKGAYHWDLNTGFDEQRRIIWHDSGAYNLDGVTKTLNFNYRLQFPVYNIDQTVTLDHMHNKDELSHKFDMDFGSDYAGMYETNLRMIEQNPLQLSGDAKLHYPGRAFEITGEVEETGPKQYSQTGTLQLREGYVMGMNSVIKLKPTIEFTSTLTAPDMSDIEVEAYINPVLSDLLIKGSVKWDQVVYSTQYTLQYSGDWRTQVSSRSAFDLVYPGRHVIETQEFNFEAETGLVTGNHIQQYDADNDPTAQTSTVYRIHLSNTEPAFYIKVDLPGAGGNFLELDTNGVFGRTMSGQATFKSKLYEIEMADEYAFGFSFEPQALGGKLHLEGSADDRQAELDLDYMLNRRWDKHAVNLEIKTPFPTWHTIKVETSHQKDPKNLDMIAAFGWDDNEVRIVSENTINWRQSRYTGGLTFTSPFEGFQNIQVTATHQIQDTLHTTDGTVRWGRGRNKALTYNQVLTIIPGSKIGVVATFVSPFRGYENLRLDSAIEKAGNTYSTNNEFQWADNRMITVVSALTVDGPEFNGNFRFTTPFESFERFVMNLSNARRRGIWISHFDMEYAPSRKIELDTQIDTTNYRKLFAELKCEACPGVGTTTFDTELKGTLLAHEFKLEFASNRLLERSILLTTDANVENINDMTANLQFRSPKVLTSMDIAFTHRKQGRVYTSNLDFTIPMYTANLNNEVRVVSMQDLSATTILTLQGDQYRFVSDIKGNPRLEISVMLYTPHENWEQIGLEVTHEGNSQRDFTTTLDITYGPNAKTESSVRYLLNRRGDLTINSQVQGLFMKDLKLDLTKQGNFYEQGLNVNLEFEYGRSRSVSTDVGGIMSRIGAYIPIVNDQVTVTFTHTGNIIDFTSNMAIGVNDKTLSTEFNYGMRGAAFGGSLEINTPWESASNIYIEVNHDGPLNNFNNDLTWRLNGREYRMENTFSYSNSRLSVDTIITTPIEGYETITANFVHSGTLTNFRSDGAIDFSGQRASLNAEFSMQDNIHASLELTTPFRRVRSLTISMDHTGDDWSDFNSNVNFVLNSQTYRANVLFRWQEQSLRLETGANTPDNQYGFNVIHSGDASDFTTTITITNPDGEIKAEVVWTMDDSGIQSTTTLTTPYDNYRRFTFGLQHRGGMEDFETTLSTTTPFQSFPTGSITVRKRGGLSDFSSGISMSWARGTIAGDIGWVKNDMRTEANLGFTTPFEGFDNFAFEFGHTWSSETAFTTSAKIDTPFEGYTTQSVVIEYAGPWSALDTSATVETSVPGYDRFMASVRNVMSNRGIEISGQVTTPIEGYENFGLTVTHSGPLTNFVTTVAIETSVRGSRRMSAEVRHNMENGIQSSFNVQTPWEIMPEMSGDLSVTPRDAGFDFTCTLNTPFENFEQQQLTVGHTMTNEWQNMDSNARFEWAQGNKNFAGQLKWDSTRRDISGIAKLTSSLRGLRTLFDAELTHTFLQRGFESSLTFTTPATETIVMDVTYSGERTDFEASANFQSGEKRIETECVFRMDDAGRAITWKLNRTPWELVQNMEIAVSRSKTGNSAEGAVAFSLNSDEKLNVEVSYTKVAPYNLHINMQSPAPMEMTVNYNPSTPTTTGDINVAYNGRTFTGDFEHTCNSDYYIIDRTLTVNTVLPWGRPMSLTTELYKSDSALRHKADVSWQRGSTANWELDLSSEYRRGQRTYTGDLKIESPAVNQEISVSHVIISDMQWTTTLSVPRGVTISHDLVRDLPNLSHTLEITHPRLRNGGIKSELTATIDPDHCTLEADYALSVEQERLSFHGKLEDESGRRERIVGEIQLAQASSHLALDGQLLLVNDYATRHINLQAVYMTSSDRRTKRFQYETVLDKATRDWTLAIVHPMKTINMVGRVKTNEGENYAYENTVTYGDKTIKEEWGYTENTVYAQVTFVKGPNEPDDVVRAQFEYNDMRDMNLEVYHITGGNQVQDVNLGIRQQRRQNVISARTYLRNNMAQDAGNYWVNNDLPHSGFVDELYALYTSARQDITTKRAALKENMGGAIRQAIQTVAGDEIAAIRQGWQRMVRNNDFYLSDILDMIGVIQELMQRNSEQIMTTLNNNIEFYHNRFSRIYQRQLTKVNEFVNRHNARLLAAIEENWDKIQDIHAYVERVVNWIDETVTAITSHPWVQSYFAFLERVKRGEFMQRVREFRASVAQWMREAEEQYELQMDILYDLWRNFQRRPEVREMRDAINRVTGWFDYINENYNIEETLIKIATKLSAITWDVVKDRIWVGMQNGMSQSSWAWDSSNSNLDLDLYVPTDIFSDIRPEIPDLYIKQQVSDAMAWLENNMPTSDWTFWDYYYTYKPSFSDPIPPFDSHATLSGTQHFMTFDRKFYEFAGECSYLLARDFIDRKFAIVVNYARPQGELVKSITVTNGYNQVEIAANGAVTKDGRAAEMPLMMDGTAILREGNVIRVKDEGGVNAYCDLTYDRCTLEVSGWYYGRTGGLLGTYDNEPVTDMMTSDRSISDDINVFARSWAVGRCRARGNEAVVQEPDENSRGYQYCAAHFMSDDSPFRHCFRIIEPEVFMRMCMNDFASPSNRLESEEQVCKTSAFYVDECSRKGVTIRVPAFCAKCERVNGEEFTGSISLEGSEIPSSADIVFVVQHAECNTPVVENLRDIIDDLEAALTSSGLTDNHYGVVGFGGFGLMEPHSHTMDGQLLNSFDKVAQALASWTDMEHGEGVADSLAAVQFAAKYPFRTGVSKSIIVIPCDACSEVDVSYRAAESMLHSRGIRMNIIMDHDFELIAGNKRGVTTSHLYGANAEGIYTRKHLKGALDSDRELYNQVVLPEDLCSSLSHRSLGAVFDVNQFTNARRADQKKFVSVMVRVFADLATPSECQNCQCVADQSGASVSVCKPCSNSLLDFSSLYPQINELFDFSDIL